LRDTSNPKRRGNRLFIFGGGFISSALLLFKSNPQVPDTNNNGGNFHEKQAALGTRP
jgi:hypothetical protein